MTDLCLCIPNVNNINEPKDSFTLRQESAKLRINKLKLLGTNYLEGRSLLLTAWKGIEFHSPAQHHPPRLLIWIHLLMNIYFAEAIVKLKLQPLGKSYSKSIGNLSGNLYQLTMHIGTHKVKALQLALHCHL